MMKIGPNHPAGENKTPGYLDGQILVAMPTIQDDRFARTVIYMCAHSSEGAMGIVINKPASNVRFRDLMEQLDVIPKSAGTEQIRVEHSSALICAGVLLATGDRAEGLRLLEELDQLLDRLEKNGWANPGLDSIRAQSLAMRGQGDAAMRSLQRAVARGWRNAPNAQTDPYLSSLWERDDFRELMKEVEARNAEMRARFLRSTPATVPDPKPRPR